jgi:hypothetical protein
MRKDGKRCVKEGRAITMERGKKSEMIRRKED